MGWKREDKSPIGLEDEYMKPHIDTLIEEYGLKTDEDPKGSIVSIFYIGSYKTGEDNESSDIDVGVLFEDGFLTTRAQREKVQQSLKPLYKKKVKFWALSEEMFIDPRRYLRLVPAEFLDLDGTDNLVPIIGYYVTKHSGVDLKGKKLKEIFSAPDPDMDPVEGYLEITTVTRDLARGLFARSEQEALEEIIQRDKDSGKFNQEDDYSTTLNHYLDKRGKLAKEEQLTGLEKRIRNYIVEMDNDIGKATLRVFYGLYIALGGGPLGGKVDRSGRKIEIYEDIVKHCEPLIDTLDITEERRDRYKALLRKSFEIKYNEKEVNGKTFDAPIEWDWSLEDSTTNKKTTKEFCEFFEFAGDLAYTQAFKHGFVWDKDRNDRLKHHLYRNIPRLAKLVAGDARVPWDALKLYVDTVVDFLRRKPLEYEKIREELPDKEFESIRISSQGMLEGILKERYEKLSEEDGREWLRRGRIYSVLADQHKPGSTDFKSRHKIALRSSDRFLKLQKNLLKSPSEAVKLRTSLDYAKGLKEMGHSFTQLGGGEGAKKYLEKSLLFNSRDPETWMLYGKPDIADHIREPRIYNLEELLPEDAKLLFRFRRRDIDRVLRFNEEVASQEMEGLQRRSFSGEPDLPKIREYISQRLEQKDRLDFMSFMRKKLKKLPGKHAYEAENIFWQKMDMLGLGPYQTLPSAFGDEFSKKLDDGMIEISSKNRAKGLKSFRRDFRYLYLNGIDEMYVKALVQDGELEDAVTYCNVLLSREENKKNANLWFHKGRAFEGLGQYRLAGASYSKAHKLDPKDFDFEYRLELMTKRLEEEFDLRSKSRYIPPTLEQTLAEIKEIPEFTKVLGALDAFYSNPNLSAPAKTALAQLTQSIYNAGGWPAILLAEKAIPIYKNVFNLLPEGTTSDDIMFLEPEISEFFKKEIGLEGRLNQ